MKSFKIEGMLVLALEAWTRSLVQSQSEIYQQNQYVTCHH